MLHAVMLIHANLI